MIADDGAKCNIEVVSGQPIRVRREGVREDFQGDLPVELRVS